MQTSFKKSPYPEGDMRRIWLIDELLAGERPARDPVEKKFVLFMKYDIKFYRYLEEYTLSRIGTDEKVSIWQSATSTRCKKHFGLEYFLEINNNLFPLLSRYFLTKFADRFLKPQLLVTRSRQVEKGLDFLLYDDYRLDEQPPQGDQ